MSHADDQLISDYAAGDRLDDATLAALEEHLFGCEACAARATALVQLVQRLRAIAAAMPPPVMTAGRLAELQQKQRVQVVDVAAFEQRHGRVSRDAELVVTRVHCELKGVEQIDVALCTREGAAFIEIFDAPFDAASGVVHVACDSHVAAKNPGFRVRVTGRRAGHRVELADCTIVQDA